MNPFYFSDTGATVGCPEDRDGRAEAGEGVRRAEQVCCSAPGTSGSVSNTDKCLSTESFLDETKYLLISPVG